MEKLNIDTNICITVGQFIDKINFLLKNNYISNDNKMIVSGNGETFLISNVAVPRVTINKNEKLKEKILLFIN